MFEFRVCAKARKSFPTPNQTLLNFLRLNVRFLIDFISQFRFGVDFRAVKNVTSLKGLKIHLSFRFIYSNSLKIMIFWNVVF